MTMTFGKVQLQASVPTSLSSKSLNATLDSDLHRRFGSRKAIRRRIRNPVTVKRIGNSVGKRSRPQTPLLKWPTADRKEEGEGEDNDEAEKFENGEEKLPQEHRQASLGDGGKGSQTMISARKLGAGLWRLQFPEVVATGDSCGLRRRDDHLGFQHDHVEDSILCRYNGKFVCSDTSGCLQSLCARSGAKNGLLCQVTEKAQKPSVVDFPCKYFHFGKRFSSGYYGYAHGPSLLLNPMNEGATKWEPYYLKKSVEARHEYSQMKLLDQVSTVQAVSVLEAELDLARLRIQELETKHQVSKKKLGQLLRKISEEKALWQSREHEKIRAFIDDIKGELNQERKTRQRVEIVNSKLVNDLADAKSSAKRFKHEYEKERKARKLIEEVCEELAKEIEEDKVEVEELKRESMKMREEVDEERKMLQMAEVWREERVQMKLVDAKIALEEKFSQMSKLVVDLEKFLRSRSATPDVNELREGIALGEAAAAVDIRDIKEFSYEPANPDDIFSIFETHFGNSLGMKIESCTEYSPESHASKIHTGSRNINMSKEEGIQKSRNNFVGPNDEIEGSESGWETVSHPEDQNSSNSPDGSTSSVNKNHRHIKYSLRGTEWEENQDGETPISEASEVCSVQSKQLKRASSIARLWKSYPKKCESFMEELNGKVSNRRMSNVTTISPDQGSDRSCLDPPDLTAQWCSPDLSNTYLTRGKNGSISQSSQKESLKAKLLEARMESQKVQLRHVLNHKI